MMHVRNNGKKIMPVRNINHAIQNIHLLTDDNPIQIIVEAIINRYYPIDSLFSLLRIARSRSCQLNG